MPRRLLLAIGTAFLILGPACVQRANDPFPAIQATEGAIALNFVEFAAVPDIGGGAPRMMLLVDEPGTSRLFVNAMQGPMYSLSYDGRRITHYLDINATAFHVAVEFSNAEQGFQSFAFHPQFNQPGARGFGKFYTYTDTVTMTPKPEFLPDSVDRVHDTILLEWTAKNPMAATYDGGPPREIFRAAQPFSNHNGGQIAFNPLASPSDADFGLLYVGMADGGSGGDPLDHAQKLTVAFGKILRIDPLGTDSANGQYGIPATNPFADDGNADTLGEIYALGLRNPQRFSWDVKTGNMFVADIGQDHVEEISLVTAGANLGWNRWEGSYPYGSRATGLSNQRGDARMTYPVAEFDHRDPLLHGGAAITGVYAYRQTAIPQLKDKLIFGDNPSGEVFFVDADNLPNGGDGIRRILFKDRGVQKTLLQLIKEKKFKQGKSGASRADLRLGVGHDGQIFVLNKQDGIIRMLVP